MRAEWWSQQFAQEGSAAAEGIVKQLGMPAMDPLTVLVREAAQNSWDARLPKGPVEFTISLWRLGNLSDTWRSLLLPGPDPEAALDLDQALRPDSFVLVVSDRNTVGLGGPLRAGHRPPAGARPDFVQFLRNIGEPNDQKYGGGTYGFGKGIYYRVSEVSTMLVDTGTLEEGAEARRLMGSALGSSWFDGEDRRHTGRHWWGVVNDDVPDPLLGTAASSTAKSLGLPGFRPGHTGTDVVVLAPDFGSVTNTDESLRTAEEAGEFMASSILWHLWPKMLPNSDGQYMRFAVEVDGEPLDLPAPDRLPELSPFVDSLMRVRNGKAAAYTRKAAPQTAGFFALESAVAKTGNASRVLEAAKPFDGPAHHIARMRTAELVVDYLPEIPHPNSLLCYGAVFKATQEADQYFADAEPPTHDTWIEKGLTGTTRGVVQRARHFLRKEIDKLFAPPPPPNDDPASSLGELASRLGGLIRTREDLEVENETTDDRKPRGTGGRRRSGTPRVTEAPSVWFSEGRPLLRAKVLVRASEAERAVEADAHVVIEGGSREKTPPVGGLTPTVLGWLSTESDAAWSDGDVLDLPPGPASEWWVCATYVPDAVVAITVRSSPGSHDAH